MAKRRVPAMLLAAVLAVALTGDPATAQSVQGVVAPITVPTTTGTMTDAVSSNAVRALAAYVDVLVDIDRVVRQWQPQVDRVAGTLQEASVRAQADAAINATIRRDG